MLTKEPMDGNSANGLIKIEWLYEALGGLGIDGLSLYFAKAFPENSENFFGFAIAQAYGLGHLAIVGCRGQYLSGPEIVPEICLLLPENAKWLRCKSMATHYWWSLPLLGFLDIVVIPASAACALMDVLQNPPTLDEAHTLPHMPGALRLA
jgi:hypothetical protein